MGGLKRLRKRWTPPKKAWNAARIKEEQELKKEFGLKNTRELWKARAELKRIRAEARARLAEKDELRESQLISRVKRYFIPKEEVTIDDVLSLDVRSVLSRRLQTIVFKKGLAATVGQARQLITHGLIAVGEKKANSPARLLSFDEEQKISWFKTLASQAPSEGAGMAAALGIYARREEKTGNVETEAEEKTRAS